MPNQGTFLDVVVAQSSAIFKLLPGKDESLLVWGNPLLILDLCLDIFNGVAGLHLGKIGNDVNTAVNDVRVEPKFLSIAARFVSESRSLGLPRG